MYGYDYSSPNETNPDVGMPMAPGIPSAAAATMPRPGIQLPTTEQAVPSAVMGFLNRAPANPWDGVPQSQRGYATLGLSPAQAMTGSSRDTNRMQAASGYLDNYARMTEEERRRGAEVAGAILHHAVAPYLTGMGNIGQQEMTNRGLVDRQETENRGNMQTEQQRGQNQLQSDFVKQFPEIAKMMGMGQPNPAQTWQSAGDGSIFNQLGDVKRPPPPPAPMLIPGADGTPLALVGGKDQTIRTIPQQPFGMGGVPTTQPQQPAAVQPVVIGGKRYREVAANTPGAVPAKSGKFYLPME